MSACVDTVELDKIIRRRKRLWGCRLVRIKVRPGGLIELVYSCYDGIHDFLVPIDLGRTSCYYFLHGGIEQIPHSIIEQNGILIEGDALRNTFCITCLNKKVAIVQVY